MPTERTSAPLHMHTRSSIYVHRSGKLTYMHWYMQVYQCLKIHDKKEKFYVIILHKSLSTRSSKKKDNKKHSNFYMKKPKKKRKIYG